MADLNLPKGLVVQGHTNLKDFVEVDKLALADYLLSIKNINTGAGGKVNLQNLIESINSTSDKNLIVQGDDGKLLVSKELFKTINDVSILGSGDVFTPSQKAAINSGVSTNTVSQVETNRTNISELDGRMTTAESDINALKGRTITAENDIDSLETRMTTAEGNIDKKQDTLISGTNIKTINGNSIIGSGDVEISSTGQGQGIPIGIVYPCLCTADYIPEGALPCNGAEYTKEQFTDLWNNYFTELGKSIYNINGSVNINNKGIANNFSSDDYVTTPVSFTLTPESNFYYKIRVKLYKSAENFNGGWRCISAFYYGDSYRTNDLSLGYYCTNNSMGFNFRLKKDDNSYGNNIASLYVDGYFDEGAWVTVEYIKTGTTFTIKVTNEFGDTNEATTENIIVKTNTYTLARIGKGNDGSSDFYASGIDLSSVLIKVDNTTIFDGNKFYNLINTCTYTEYASDISTYGQCGKFAVDTVNNKFRVPLIKDGSVIQQALTDDKLGKSYNAGLPNITGSWVPGIRTSSAQTISGAFEELNGSTITSWSSSSSNIPHGFTFDASRSSSIYGNSDTVQPNAVALRYFVVVANGQINQSMMDWSAWASSLQGKANTDLSNLSNSGKKVIDGQWVLKFKSLFTSTAVGTYTVDLSDYLPNDNCNYEILGHAYISRAGHTSGTNTQMIVYSPSTDETPSSDMDGFIKVQADGANWQQGDNQSICVVGLDRTLTVGIYSTNAKETKFAVVAYRRIGINE